MNSYGVSPVLLWCLRPSANHFLECAGLTNQFQQSQELVFMNQMFKRQHSMKSTKNRYVDKNRYPCPGASTRAEGLSISHMGTLNSSS